jgi:hypothetical protein
MAVPIIYVVSPVVKRLAHVVGRWHAARIDGRATDPQSESPGLTLGAPTPLRPSAAEA